MRTELGHYKITALLVMFRLLYTVGITPPKVARSLKLSTYLTKQLIADMQKAGLITVDDYGITINRSGYDLLNEGQNSTRAEYHLAMINEG